MRAHIILWRHVDLGDMAVDGLEWWKFGGNFRIETNSFSNLRAETDEF